MAIQRLFECPEFFLLLGLFLCHHLCLAFWVPSQEFETREPSLQVNPFQ